MAIEVTNSSSCVGTTQLVLLLLAIMACCAYSYDRRPAPPVLLQATPPATLEPSLIQYFIRPVFTLPLSALRSAGGALRRLVKTNLAKEPAYTHNCVQDAPAGLRLYETLFRPSTGINNDDAATEDIDYIIYFHGGAFALCDCGDLFIARGLLPLLSTSRGNRPTAVMSLLYSLTSGVEGVGHFPLVQKEVLAAFDFFRSTRSGKCLGIVGDSAGANAALSLVQQLLARGDSSLPKHLVLLSPWLDLWDECAEIETRPDYHDMLISSALVRCRAAYLGSAISTPTDVGLLHDSAGQLAASEVLAKKFAMLCKATGIQCVAFDMDQCLANAHSRGRLLRKNLPGFTDKITSDFVTLARACAAEGLHLAIATHSDAHEYTTLGRSKEAYIIGEELALECLKAAGLDSDAFFIQAYNPRARGEASAENRGKKRHIRNIAAHYAIEEQACLLLDDDDENVKDTDGRFRTVQVEASKGLELRHALKALASQCNPAHIPDNLFNRHAMSLACPSGLSDEVLDSLPDVLVVLGEKELISAQIERFSQRLQTSKTRVSLGKRSELVVGEGDIHAYPLHHIHPIRQVMQACGSSWLFDLLFPQRAVYHRETGCDSPQALAAFEAIAAFMTVTESSSDQQSMVER